MKSARLAFLSTAHIHTKGFIENVLQTDDGRSVTAIWDDVPDRGRRYAEMATCPFVADLDALLADPEIDGFVICAENTRHFDLLRAVLPLGKPVLCEKPLLTDTEGLDEVIALARQHHTILISGYFMPFSAAMRGVADFLASGDAGTPTRVRVVNAHHAAYGRWFDNPDLDWFTRPVLSGGGAFMDLGTHALHLLRTLLGSGAVIAADIRNHSGQYPGTDDAGIALVLLDSGAIGTVEASWIHNGGFNGIEIQTTLGAILKSGDGFEFHRPGQPPLTIPKAADQPTCVDRLVAAIHGTLPAAETDADLTHIADTVTWMTQAYRKNQSPGGS